jgi:hypothetical protein
MFRKIIIMTGLTTLLLVMLATTAISASTDNLGSVRAATAKFHKPEAAQAAGWDLVPGLDHCFENPGVGAMGYHYINTALLDTSLNALKPEAMVYAPKKNGKLKLAAVEYIVPAEAWDNEGNFEPPSLHGQSFHLNENLGVYVLHAWIWKNNPSGMFEDWNPRVSCP